MTLGVNRGSGWLALCSEFPSKAPSRICLFEHDGEAGVALRAFLDEFIEKVLFSHSQTISRDWSGLSLGGSDNLVKALPKSLVQTRQQVAVSVEGQRDCGVAESFLDLLRMSALRD